MNVPFQNHAMSKRNLLMEFHLLELLGKSDYNQARDEADTYCGTQVLKGAAAVLKLLKNVSSVHLQLVLMVPDVDLLSYAPAEHVSFMNDPIPVVVSHTGDDA